MITREGNFSSSNIHRLCAMGRSKDSIGEPFYTYVSEKKREILAGRSIHNEAAAKATEWGHLCEPFINDLLPLEHALVSQERYKHPSLPWTGAPDGLEGDNIVTDIKAPYTLTKFFDKYEIRETPLLLKSAAKENYWQLISNSILTNRPICKLYLFMPKLSMIEAIKAESQIRGYWFHHKEDNELPWTTNESTIKPITVLEFEAPQEDIDFLTERVRLAGDLLTK